jgi:hypothetical protein
VSTAGGYSKQGSGKALYLDELSGPREEEVLAVHAIERGKNIAIYGGVHGGLESSIGVCRQRCAWRRRTQDDLAGFMTDCE